MSTIQSFLPNNPVVWVSLEEVRLGLAAQVMHAKDALGPDAFVVTLSRLYFYDADREISCTRVVDNCFTSLGLAERPPAKKLALQVQSIVEEAGNRPIIVVDDTLFHGQTIVFLKGLGLPVKAAVEYFSAKKACEDLRSQGIAVYTVCTLEDYLDVMPLHDFLPIVPLCGKVVGETNGDGVKHRGLENGTSMSVPYLMPYITAQMLRDWASIPWEHARDFSAFALTQAVVLAERMSQVGLCTIADVKAYQPHRVSIPLLDGSMPDDDVLLTDVIRRAVHKAFCA